MRRCIRIPLGSIHLHFIQHDASDNSRKTDKGGLAFIPHRLNDHTAATVVISAAVTAAVAVTVGEINLMHCNSRGSGRWHGGGGSSCGDSVWHGGGSGSGGHCRPRTMIPLEPGFPTPRRQSCRRRAAAPAATSSDASSPHRVAGCSRISSCRHIH